jgi:hypothetical protein
MWVPDRFAGGYVDQEEHPAGMAAAEYLHYAGTRQDQHELLAPTLWATDVDRVNGEGAHGLVPMINEPQQRQTSVWDSQPAK